MPPPLAAANIHSPLLRRKDLLATHPDPQSQTHVPRPASAGASAKTTAQPPAITVTRTAEVGERSRAVSFREHTLFANAQDNNLEDCVRLLAEGQDVNQVFSSSLLRPLHVAATCGSLEVGTQLLNAGADPNAMSVNEEKSEVR